MMQFRTPLRRVTGLGAAHTGTHHWWRQRLTAIANIPLVIAALVIMVSLTGASHSEVVARLSNPVVATIMIAAIVSLAIHMRLGMQVIIEDYVHTPAMKIAAIIANGLFSAAVMVIGVVALAKIALGG